MIADGSGLSRVVAAWRAMPAALRLFAVAVLSLVGIIGGGLAWYEIAPKSVSLPYRDLFTDERGVLPEWDDSASRGHYLIAGYEILVKQQGRTGTAIPNTFWDWDVRIGVTVELGEVHPPAAVSESVPYVGVLCVAESKDGPHYDFRVGADGRYGLFRQTKEETKLLVSNFALGTPLLSIRGPLRLEAECIRRSPITMRLRVNGEEVLSFRDVVRTGWGRAGLFVGTGGAPRFHALFRELAIDGR